MKINKRFQDYVDNSNRWNAVFKKPEVKFPLSQKDVNDLGNKLSGELSPENLCCDGEISAKQAGVKFRKLSNVVKDLKAYANKNGLVEPNIDY